MSSRDLPADPSPSAHATEDAVNVVLAAVLNRDAAGATAVLRAEPQVARTSLHVAAVLGLDAEVRRLIAGDVEQVHLRAGTPSGDPLLWLCYSPFHGESPERDAGLLAAARALLEAGADPNTRDGHYGVPALYAVTGMNHVPGIARLLLDAGAQPTDGESLHHAAENFHEEALELLLSYGADLNATGEWGNTPLYFLLRYWDVAQMPRVKQGIHWLLDHGADPNVHCGREQETSLHVAVRRRQHPEIVKLLLHRGAQVNARRGDGRTVWDLAARAGSKDITMLLEEFGAARGALSPTDELMAACGRGDADAAHTLSSPDIVASLEQEDLRLLPDAASTGRLDVVRACIAAGFPVDTADEAGATALHHAAIHGSAAMVRALVQRGADLHILDREHTATPLGWACFGADYVADTSGDYIDTVTALLQAGAHHSAVDHEPAHAGVRAALGLSPR